MFSSNVVYTGDDFISTAFRCGAVYHPFRPAAATVPSTTSHTHSPVTEYMSDEGIETAERSPLLCLKCAGFLNMYCSINEQNGEWQCSLCKHTNPSFLAQSTTEDLEAYSELHHSIVEFSERDLTPIYTPPGVTEHIHLIAIDNFVSSVENVEDFLRNSLNLLKDDTRVCIIGFGKSINILRLCGGGESDTAIVVDTLPGTRDCSHTFRHFFQQGEFLTPASKALLIVKDIAGALKCMAAGSLDNKTITNTTCSTLVQVARGIGDVHGPGVKMLLITARTIPLGLLPIQLESTSKLDAVVGGGVGNGSDSSQEDKSLIEGYAALGNDACVMGRCWIDVVVVGLHAVKLDLFDALASASGGTVVAGYSLDEEVVMASIEHFLCMPASCFPPHINSMTDHRQNTHRRHMDGTILFEVRTSAGVMPETIYGPVIMQNQHESSRIWGQSNTDIKSMCSAVDKAHVVNMVNITSAQGSPDIDLNPEIVYAQLCSDCNASDRVVSCAMHRGDPDFALSFLLHPSENLANTDGAVVQLVLRWCKISNTKNGYGECCYMSRIMTYQLPGTDNKKDFLAAVDVDIWSSMAARAISGDLHAATDGLGLPKSIKQEKKDPIAALLTSDNEVSITKEVDDVVREVITHFKDDNYAGVVKVHQMCRMLYHLREGPLLNGPCVNSQESYMLRSVFLAFSPDHFFTLVQGSLQLLDPSSLPAQCLKRVDELAIESWIITSATNASPDSMNMLPDHIAVIDLGNFILIRAGMDVDDEGVCPSVEKVIRRRIEGRHPYPSLFKIKARSPQERMAFSRLNPSHTDSHERIQQTLPLLANMSKNDLDDHIAYLPYTDQRSYIRYMFNIAPMFTRNMLGLLAGQSEGEDYLSERGRSFPTVSENMDRGGCAPTLPVHNSTSVPPPPISQVLTHPSLPFQPPPYPPPHVSLESISAEKIDDDHLTVKYPPPPPPATATPDSVRYPPPPPMM